MSNDDTKWADPLVREGHRRLPSGISTAYFDLLTERGYLERDAKLVKPTKTFVGLLAKSVESLRNWYKPLPGDDPLTLVALEMSRFILNVNPAQVRETSKREELGRLSNVLVRLLRTQFRGRDRDRLMAIILGDDKI